MLAALIMALIPHCSVLGILFLAFVLNGVASLVINVGGNTLIGAVHGPRVGTYINGIHFAFGLGGFLTPLIAKQFVQSSNALVLSYSTFGAVLGVLAVGAWLTPSPVIQHHHAQRKAEPLNKALAVLLVLFLFLEVGAESTVSGWLFSYALRSGAPEPAAYNINSAFWAAFTIGRLLSIPVAMRLSQRTMLFWHLYSWSALSLILLLLPATTLTLWLCAIGMGFGMAPIFPTILALGQQALRASGQVTGWLLCGAGIGAMFCPWLVGQLIGRLGASVFVWIILIELIGALFVLNRFFAKAGTTNSAEDIQLIASEEPL
jgi:FHS family Na+ dependent glucose MFS transporter 1